MAKVTRVLFKEPLQRATSETLSALLGDLPSSVPRFGTIMPKNPKI